MLLFTQGHGWNRRAGVFSSSFELLLLRGEIYLCIIFVVCVCLCIYVYYILMKLLLPFLFYNSFLSILYPWIHISSTMNLTSLCYLYTFWMTDMILFDNCLQVFATGFVPYVGKVLNFLLLSWMYAYYCFEYVLHVICWSTCCTHNCSDNTN